MLEWDFSAKKIVDINGAGAMAPACGLCPTKLLAAEVDESWPEIKGRAAKSLVKAGEKKARETGQPVVLKLRAGDRGKFSTRVMLPPEPPRIVARSSLGTCPTKPVSGATARRFTKQTPPPANSKDQVAVTLAQFGELSRQVELLTQTVDRWEAQFGPDLEGISQMYDAMVRRWREIKGLPLANPTPPKIDLYSTGVEL